MNPIRPSVLPQAPAAQPGAAVDAGKLAAQKAFFAAAFGQTQAPQAAPAAPHASAAAPVQRMPDPAAEPPTKILRPGSLLDIRI